MLPATDDLLDNWLHFIGIDATFPSINTHIQPMESFSGVRSFPDPESRAQCRVRSTSNPEIECLRKRYYLRSTVLYLIYTESRVPEVSNCDVQSTVNCLHNISHVICYVLYMVYTQQSHVLAVSIPYELG